MEMELDINITKLQITINPCKPKKISEKAEIWLVGFSELQWFISDNELPYIIVRGITIKIKNFKGVKKYCVDFPGYMGRFKFNISFILNEKLFFEEVKQKILRDFQEKIGDVNPEQYLELSFSPRKEEYVDPNEIPI